MTGRGWRNLAAGVAAGVLIAGGCGFGEGSHEGTQVSPGGRCDTEGSYGYYGDDTYVCTNKDGELTWVKSAHS